VFYITTFGAQRVKDLADGLGYPLEKKQPEVEGSKDAADVEMINIDDEETPKKSKEANYLFNSLFVFLK
jgi:hypothetical protein